MILAFLNKQTGKSKLVVGNPLVATIQGFRLRQQGFERAKIESINYKMVDTIPNIVNCHATGDGHRWGGLTNSD